MSTVEKMASPSRYPNPGLAGQDAEKYPLRVMPIPHANVDPSLGLGVVYIGPTNDGSPHLIPTPQEQSSWQRNTQEMLTSGPLRMSRISITPAKSVMEIRHSPSLQLAVNWNQPSPLS